MQSSMASIPEDVIIEILCRLPVKTLLRFRCVSKRFRSIIDDPGFINRHLQNHRSLNRRKLIVEGIPANLFSIDLDSADNAFKLELPFESRDSDFCVIGSCDGLLAFTIYHHTSICLWNHHTSICLWNISTRKHEILPLPKFWSDYDYIRHNVFDGFGYDATTDDYKWVRVISDREFRNEVTVYSLKANSWRRIENYPPPYPYYTVNGIGVLVGSALNWLVGVIIDERRVMSFDLKGENFDKVSLPDIADDAEAEAEFDIVAFEGCLCLCYFYAFKTALDVWVMKEYGVKESWNKLFRLSEETLLRRGDLYRGTVAFACSKSSNKVLVYQVNGEVFWHELDRKTDESIEINEWPTNILNATIYVDSLVSPKIGI